MAPKTKYTLAIIGSIHLMLLSQAQANPAEATSTSAATAATSAASAANESEEGDSGRDLSSRRFGLFFGTDLGIASLNSDVPGESNKTGHQFSLKLLGSYYFAQVPVVVDLGGGWLRARTEGTAPAFQVSGWNTRAGFAELGVRYDFSEGWQIGPYFDILFGANLRFSPLDTDPARKTTPTFAGVQVFREINDDTTDLRIGFRVGTDLSIPDRNLVSGQFSFQIGLPTGSSSKEATVATSHPISTEQPLEQPQVIAPVVQQQAPAQQQAPVVAPVQAAPVAPAPAPAPEFQKPVSATTPTQEAPQQEQPSAVQPVVVPVITSVPEAKAEPEAKPEQIMIEAKPTSVEMSLGSDFINFATAKAQITPSFRGYLTDLSRVLKDNKAEWNNLVVEGHADERGTDDYNDGLSERRANAVCKALMVRGIDPNRVGLERFGEKKPLESGEGEKSWSKNRRVEIRIMGVKNPEAFAEKLRGLRAAKIYPTKFTRR